MSGNSTTVQEPLTVEPLKTEGVPVDQCCLVVQMPSVEEMRKEVADITCQMQSVYLNDDKSSQGDRETSVGPVVDAESRKNSIDTSLGKSSPTMKFGTISLPATMTRLTDGGDNHTNARSKSNTISRMIGIEKETTIEPTRAQSSMSSKLPREEQVSEEFVINGRRYRQTYHRRIVLERRTTRDVFFLPASSAEPETKPTGVNTLEYTSPRSSQKHDDIVDGSVLENYAASEECRPTLDLAVVRGAQGEANEDSCISPAVIMRTNTGQPKNVVTGRMNGSDGHAEGDSESVRRIKQKRSRSKYLVKDVAETIRKHIKSNLRRTKSNFGRKSRLYSNEASLDIRSRDSANGNYENQTAESYQGGNQEIVGYMYKFGVWDNQAPVLDPRLPIAMNSSLMSKAGLTGAVIALPPEWHHAEVATEHLDAASGPLVRGRIVACLQRFTQHSPTSGKALHRSTYVQQTRLVRQRNKNADSKSQSHEDRFNALPSAPLLLSPMAEPESDLKETEGEFAEGFLISKSKMSWKPHEAKFSRCSNDRLQLLQSLCPSAAAATILLGRQFLAQPDSSSENESEDATQPSESNHTNEAQVLVGASSWCPQALIARDLSPYLVFGESRRETPKESSPTEENKKSPEKGFSYTGGDDILRGGTLSGLIAYALRLLKYQDKGKWVNALLPNVLKVTYPTFTNPDTIVEKLIQAYVAYAPIEPGCQSAEWTDALTAAEYLISIANELSPEQLSARLVLRLARFARLLISDGAKSVQKPGDKAVSAEDNKEQVVNKHKMLADNLLENLPLLSATAQLRERAACRGWNTARSARRKSTQPSRRNDSFGTEGNQKPQETTTLTANKSSVTGEDASLSPLRNNGQIKRLLSQPMGPEDCPPGRSVSQVQQKESFMAVLERTENFLKIKPEAIAVEITRMEEEKFAQIDFHEFLDIRRLERGEAPTLRACVDHFNHVTAWARSLLFVFGPKLVEHVDATRGQTALNQNGTPIKSHIAKGKKKESNAKKLRPASRDIGDFDESDEDSSTHFGCLPTVGSHFSDQKTMRLRQLGFINLIYTHMCSVLRHVKILKNFSSFLALLLALQEVPECLLSKKARSLFQNFSSYMTPPMFTEYRRDLENATPPYLPYLGLIFQQLIHLNVGNSLYLPQETLNQSPTKQTGDNDYTDPYALIGAMNNMESKPEKMINMWRCLKHYLILGYFVKRKEEPETSRHKLPSNKEVQAILNNFEDRLSDAILDKAKEQLICKTGGK
ncbi:unnamed protein product [Calicophoron daubneyi]|uniref:Ras-GEF domain-containing protein n=1 Tax=Calicophoron daubneyi TaxID=300641 RepID=A0AAV2TA30_CALDB